MIIVQKIETKQDVNGNPRRGWMVYNRQEMARGTGRAVFLGFVDEGFGGDHSLRTMLTQAGVVPFSDERTTSEWIDRHVVTLGIIEVTPRQYNHAKRNPIVALA